MFFIYLKVEKSNVRKTKMRKSISDYANFSNKMQVGKPKQLR